MSYEATEQQRKMIGELMPQANERMRRVWPPSAREADLDDLFNQVFGDYTEGPLTAEDASVIIHRLRYILDNYPLREVTPRMLLRGEHLAMFGGENHDPKCKTCKRLKKRLKWEDEMKLTITQNRWMYFTKDHVLVLALDQYEQGLLYRTRRAMRDIDWASLTKEES